MSQDAGRAVERRLAHIRFYVLASAAHQGAFDVDEVPGAARTNRIIGDTCVPITLTGRLCRQSGILPDFLGDDRKLGQLVWAERGDHRNVCSISLSSDKDAANSARIVARIKRVPATSDEGFHPGIEVHGGRVRRNADIAEVPVAVSRRNVQATTKRYREMRKVAAHSNLLVHCLRCRTGRARFGIAEAQAVIHIVANGLHSRVPASDRSESPPGKIKEEVCFAVAAATKIRQRVRWQGAARSLSGASRRNCSNFCATCGRRRGLRSGSFPARPGQPDDRPSTQPRRPGTLKAVQPVAVVFSRPIKEYSMPQAVTWETGDKSVIKSLSGAQHATLRDERHRR